MYLNRTGDIIDCMNKYGKMRSPFLFAISYDMQEAYLFPVAELNRTEDVLYDFGGNTNTRAIVKRNYVSPVLIARPVSFVRYKRSFDIVHRNLLRGNSFLTNLTCATPVQCNLSANEIFYRSKAPYKLYIKGRFVVFSPETFVRIQHGMISSYPMKGTIDASLPNARERILGDVKESAEHATIVDLIRNDLSRVATQVEVSRYRYIDLVNTSKGDLLQVSSEINGRLEGYYNERLGDILFSLLPAGSITGAPKKKTMEIIAEAETCPRGFYTGVMGYFDGFDLDSAVMIRFMEIRETDFLFKSGGGITAKSRAEAEYNEMKQKIYVPICRNLTDTGW